MLTWLHCVWCRPCLQICMCAYCSLISTRYTHAYNVAVYVSVNQAVILGTVLIKSIWVHSVDSTTLSLTPVHSSPLLLVQFIPVHSASFHRTLGSSVHFNTQPCSGSHMLAEFGFQQTRSSSALFQQAITSLMQKESFPGNLYSNHINRSCLTCLQEFSTWKPEQSQKALKLYPYNHRNIWNTGLVLAFSYSRTARHETARHETARHETARYEAARAQGELCTPAGMRAWPMRWRMMSWWSCVRMMIPCHQQKACNHIPS